MMEKVGVERLAGLRVAAEYVTAALLAYLSRVFWPSPVTPQAISVAVHAIKARICDIRRILPAEAFAQKPAPGAPSRAPDLGCD